MRRQAPREKKTAWQQEDYKKNPEKYREATRRYRAAHPDRIRAYKASLPKAIPKPKVVRTHCGKGHNFEEVGVYEYVAQSGNIKGKVVKECKACIKDKTKNRALQSRAIHLKNAFGLSLADYDQMLKAQNGVCAICETVESGHKTGSFQVDHCHSSGKIRKLLCINCNTAIGRAKDDIDILRKMITYLEAHK